MKGFAPIPPHVRMMQKVEMVTESGCWIYMGGLSEQGYARVGVGSKTDGSRGMAKGHRVMYEAYRGPIPDGLPLDHLCRVRCCVNPWHMEAVTHRENCLRGDSLMAKCARRPVCPRCGGEWSVVNYPSTGLKRACLKCVQVWSKQRTLRRRAKRAA